MDNQVPPDRINFPSSLKLSSVIQEIKFRIKSLESWKSIVEESNISTEGKIEYQDESSNLITKYSALLNLKSFSKSDIDLLKEIDDTSLLLEQMRFMNPKCRIISYPRLKKQGEVYKSRLNSIPTCIQYVMHPHTSIVSDIIVTSDSRFLIYSSFDCAIRIWSIIESLPVMMLLEHANYVSCIALASNQKILFSGSHDSKVIVWDLEKEKSIFTIKGFSNSPVLKITISTNDEYLAVSCKSGYIALYHLKKAIQSYYDNGSFSIECFIDEFHNTHVKCMEFTKNSQKLLAGSYQKGILVFDMVNSSKFFINLHEKIVNDFKIFDNESKVISGGQDLKLIIWDLNKQKFIHSVESGFQGYISSIVVVDHKKLAFISGRNNFICQFDLITLKFVRRINTIECLNNRLHLFNDSQLIACSDNIISYDIDSGEVRFNIEISPNTKIVSFDHYKGYFLGLNKKGETMQVNLNSYQSAKYSNDLLNISSVSFTSSFNYYVQSDGLSITVKKNTQSLKNIN